MPILGSLLGIRHGRPALRPRSLRVVHSARTFWKNGNARLSDVTVLSEGERAILRPVVRQHAVRYAAASQSCGAFLLAPLKTASYALCLIGPVLLLVKPATSRLSAAEIVLAAAVYLTLFGTLCGVYFGWRWYRPVLVRLSWLGAAGSSLVAVVVMMMMMTTDPWPAVRYGIVAGGLALLVIVVGSVVAAAIGGYVLFPLMFRAMATMPPSWLAASQLLNLLHRIEDASAAWRTPSTRRRLANWAADTYFELTMRHAVWYAGFRGRAYSTPARHHVQQIGAFQRSIAWRVLDCVDRSGFDRIRRDVASAAVAVATGDWTPLPVQTLPRWPLLATMLRRLIVAGALAATALLLPELPGVALTGTHLASVQIALIIGAVLSLTPIDPASRERILGAFDKP